MDAAQASAYAVDERALLHFLFLVGLWHARSFLLGAGLGRFAARRRGLCAATRPKMHWRVAGMGSRTLSPAEVEQWHEHGYVFVRHFWDQAVVAAMQAEASRLVEIGLVRNVATLDDGMTHSDERVNLQLDPVIVHSVFFRMLAFHPAVKAAVGALVGSPFLLEEDQLFWKPARHGVGTSWHTDNSYFKISDPLGGTAMWTAIHDATAENGTLQVVVDGFREHWEHWRDPGSDHHIRTEVADREVATAELDAGGVAFFCYGTPHSTGDNATGRPRAAVAYHYTYFAFRQPANPKDPFVTGPKAESERLGARPVRAPARTHRREWPVHHGPRARQPA